MLHTTFIISYFDPVQIIITISYVFSIVYHINIYGILLLMPASSVAIALAFRKNRSLGKTFWFTADEEDWFGEGVKLVLKGNLTSCDSPEALYKTCLLVGERL